MASGNCCTESWFGTMQSPSCAPLWPAVCRSPAGKCRRAVGAFAFVAAQWCSCAAQHRNPAGTLRRCSQPGLWCCSVPCWATARSPQTAATSSASLPVVKGANQQVYCHALQAPEGESRLRVSNFAAIILIFVYCELPNWGLRYEKFNVRGWKAFFTWKKAQNICNLLSLASGLLFCTFF